MKKIIIVLLAFAGLTTTASANVVNFTGYYDAPNWTQIIDAGSIDISGAPSSIFLTSGQFQLDGGSPPSDQDFTIAALQDAIISFSWDYITNDESAAFDPFGYLLNGNLMQLTDDNQIDQFGDMLFAVSAGDIFGFRAHSTDSCCGTATTEVFNFLVTTADVPEPAPLALLGFGLLGFAALRRRKLAA